jgi:hypothetical protein
MIQVGLHVTDRLATLLSWQGEQDEKVFTGLIDPMYRDAESMVYDYTSLYLDLIMQIYCQDEVDGMIHWLERHRISFMPLRVKIRALEVPKTFGHDHGHTNKAMVKFKQGMLGLMQGSVSLVEDGDTPLGKYGYNGPTLLRQLYSHLHHSLSDHRRLYLDIAKKQFQAIERVREEVIESYAVLKFAHQATKRYETRAAFLVT